MSENLPLAGRRILVTRARDQAPALADPLVALGAEVILAPAIRLVDPPNWSLADRAIRELDAYDWIVFTSANAVTRWLARLAEHGVEPGSFGKARTAVIGEATAEGLTERGFAVDAMAEEFRAEGLSEVLGRKPLDGKRVLVPRALVARDVMPRLLRDRGAIVDVVPVYATEPDPAGVETTRRAFGEGGVDAVTLTSSSIVDAFLEALEPERSQEAAEVEPRAGRLASRLHRTCLASIGPVTSATIRSHGLEPTVEASPYTVPALVRALAEHLAESKSVDPYPPRGG